MKRRNFIIKTLKGSLITSLPLSLSSFNLKNNKVEIGVAADVHQDIIHDGFSRLSFFNEPLSINGKEIIYPSDHGFIVASFKLKYS